MHGEWKREEKRRERNRGSGSGGEGKGEGRRGREWVCERTERNFSPGGSLEVRAVIYRPEPSPSLTPLLRNYTQSVANKSKKVLAVLVRIHGTSAVFCPSPIPSPRPSFSYPPALHTIHSPFILSLSLFLSPHVVNRANLRGQFDRDSGPDNQRTAHPCLLHFKDHFRPNRKTHNQPP